MAVAMIHPEGDKGGRGIKTSSNLAETAGFSQRCLQQARFILRHAPDLASQVRAGHLSLDNAHEEARVRKGRSDTYDSRFNALKAAAPDLAELVVEEKLTLEEAQVAYDQRVSEERHRACSIDWHRRCRPREQLAGIAPTAREGNQSRPFYSNGEIFYAKDESTPGWRRLRSPCRCWASSMLK
jgi:hypothetical protein